jgi:CRISPR/Cas system-associated endoribonuclease Cas2
MKIINCSKIVRTYANNEASAFMASFNAMFPNMGTSATSPVEPAPGAGITASAVCLSKRDKNFFGSEYFQKVLLPRWEKKWEAQRIWATHKDVARLRRQENNREERSRQATLLKEAFLHWMQESIHEENLTAEDAKNLCNEVKSILLADIKSAEKTDLKKTKKGGKSATRFGLDTLAAMRVVAVLNKKSTPYRMLRREF